MRRPRFRAASVIVAATVSVLLAGLLTGCGGSHPSDGGPSASPTATGHTTPPGTELRLRQPAIVDWSPKAGVAGKLAISVDAMETTSFKQAFSGWKLDSQLQSRAPYFVRATVRNAGDTDLGGNDVPLWGLDADNNLVEPAAFTEAFKPCQPKTLPTPFPPGKSMQVCLVVLVPDQGRLEGVSYRPNEDFQPITWKGDLTAYTPSPSPSDSAKPSPAAKSPSSPAAS